MQRSANHLKPAFNEKKITNSLWNVHFKFDPSNMLEQRKIAYPLLLLLQVLKSDF